MLFEDRAGPVATSTLSGSLSTFSLAAKEKYQKKGRPQHRPSAALTRVSDCGGAKTRSDESELRQFGPLIRSTDTHDRLR